MKSGKPGWDYESRLSLYERTLKTLVNIHFALDFAWSPAHLGICKAELSTLYRDREVMMARLKRYRR